MPIHSTVEFRDLSYGKVMAGKIMVGEVALYSDVCVVGVARR
jgi:hypothetical protein